MARSRLEFRLDVALLALVAGCSSPVQTSARDAADANDTGRTFGAENPSERALLAQLATLPNGAPRRVGEAIVVGGGPVRSSQRADLPTRADHVWRKPRAHPPSGVYSAPVLGFVPECLARAASEVKAMRGSLSQLLVVHALLLVETRRVSGKPARLTVALAHPVLWIGMFAGLYFAFGRPTPPGMSTVAFLTTGIVPFSLFRETATRCLSAVDSNKGLLFYPLVRPLDLVIARAVLEAVTQLVVMAILMGTVALYNGQFKVQSLLDTGFGLAGGGVVPRSPACCGLSVTA